MNGYADDLAAVIEALDLCEVTLVGHSTGAAKLHATSDGMVPTARPTGAGVHTSDVGSEQLLNSAGGSLRALKPATDAQLSTWNDAREQYRKVLELRWTLVEQAEGSIPTPLLGMVIAWLVLVFGSFGYGAPHNLIVVTSFVAASALISCALYLIVDMDEPFTGPIQISSAPRQRVMAEIIK